MANLSNLLKLFNKPYNPIDAKVREGYQSNSSIRLSDEEATEIEKRNKGRSVLDLIAQYNAQLPKEKGGLDLPYKNTAEDRLKAQYLPKEYHGTSADIRKQDRPIFMTDDIDAAVEYAEERAGTSIPEGYGSDPVAVYDLLPPKGDYAREGDIKEAVRKITGTPYEMQDEPFMYVSEGWLPESEAVTEFLKSQGYVGAKDLNDYRIGGQDEITSRVVFGDTPVRSSRAVGDPMRSKSKNILASLIPAAFLSSEANASSEGKPIVDYILPRGEHNIPLVGPYLDDPINLINQGLDLYYDGYLDAAKEGDIKGVAKAIYDTSVGDLEMNLSAGVGIPALTYLGDRAIKSFPHVAKTVAKRIPALSLLIPSGPLNANEGSNYELDWQDAQTNIMSREAQKMKEYFDEYGQTDLLMDAWKANYQASPDYKQAKKTYQDALLRDQLQSKIGRN